jgi:hypothetical protein
VNDFRPMVGHLLAVVVFVDGPAGSSASFTATEKAAMLRAAFAGTGILRILSDTWSSQQAVPVPNLCGFTVAQRTVSLTRDPAELSITPPSFAQREKVWLTDATAEMGFTTGSVSERVEAMRRGLFALTFLGLGVADAFPIFVTKYACAKPAHAPDGFVVLSWPDVGADVNLDGVVAHEIGHVFGALDEYGHCSAVTPAGFFDTPNANCVFLSQNPDVPNPDPRVPCLMDQNAHSVCPSTPVHWGWADADGDGFPDLAAQATIELPSRLAPPGRTFTIKGRNVWDARAVFFGNEAATDVRIAAADTIFVTVPTNVSGIVNLSLLTRAGGDGGTFDDTWVIASPDVPRLPSPGPIVFGVKPDTGPAGTLVTILGAQLARPTSVTFGGVPADLSDVDEFGGLGEAIDVPAPPGPTGTVDVVVTTSNGASPPFLPFTRYTYP